MFCRKCGVELPENSKFCWNCGENIDKENQTFNKESDENDNSITISKTDKALNISQNKGVLKKGHNLILILASAAVLVMGITVIFIMNVRNKNNNVSLVKEERETIVKFENDFENESSIADIQELDNSDSEKDYNLPEDDIFQVTDELGNVLLTSIQIAEIGVIEWEGSYGINIKLTDAGSDLLFKATEANVGKRLHMLVDGQLYDSPVVKFAVSGGKFIIPGFSTYDEAITVVGLILSSTSAEIKESDICTSGTAVSTDFTVHDTAIVVYDKFYPEPSMQTETIYERSDGEIVYKENTTKFKVNGVYITDAWVRDDNGMFYSYFNSNGDQGFKLGYAFWEKANQGLINLYPGHTEARDLNYSKIILGEDNGIYPEKAGYLYRAIVNSLFEEKYGNNYNFTSSGDQVSNSTNYPRNITYRDRYFMDGLRVDIWNYDIPTTDGIQYDIEISTRDFGTEDYANLIDFVFELLTPLANIEDIKNAISCCDIPRRTGNNDKYIIDGYFGEVTITYRPQIHGNCISFEGVMN